MISPTLAEFPAGSLELDLSQGDNRRSISTLAFQGEHEISDAFTLDFSSNFTRGVLDGTSPDAVFESTSATERSPRALFNPTVVSSGKRPHTPSAAGEAVAMLPASVPRA